MKPAPIELSAIDLLLRCKLLFVLWLSLGIVSLVFGGRSCTLPSFPHYYSGSLSGTPIPPTNVTCVSPTCSSLQFYLLVASANGLCEEVSISQCAFSNTSSCQVIQQFLFQLHNFTIRSDDEPLAIVATYMQQPAKLEVLLTCDPNLLPSDPPEISPKIIKLNEATYSINVVSADLCLRTRSPSQTLTTTLSRKSQSKTVSSSDILSPNEFMISESYLPVSSSKLFDWLPEIGSLSLMSSGDPDSPSSSTIVTGMVCLQKDLVSSSDSICVVHRNTYFRTDSTAPFLNSGDEFLFFVDASSFSFLVETKAVYKRRFHSSLPPSERIIPFTGVVIPTYTSILLLNSSKAVLLQPQQSNWDNIPVKSYSTDFQACHDDSAYFSFSNYEVILADSAANDLPQTWIYLQCTGSTIFRFPLSMFQHARRADYHLDVHSPLIPRRGKKYFDPLGNQGNSMIGKTPFISFSSGVIFASGDLMNAPIGSVSFWRVDKTSNQDKSKYLLLEVPTRNFFASSVQAMQEIHTYFFEMVYLEKSSSDDLPFCMFLYAFQQSLYAYDVEDTASTELVWYHGLPSRIVSLSHLSFPSANHECLIVAFLSKNAIYFYDCIDGEVIHRMSFPMDQQDIEISSVTPFSKLNNNSSPYLFRVEKIHASTQTFSGTVTVNLQNISSNFAAKEIHIEETVKVFNCSNQKQVPLYGFNEMVVSTATGSPKLQTLFIPEILSFSGPSQWKNNDAVLPILYSSSLTPSTTPAGTYLPNRGKLLPASNSFFPYSSSTLGSLSSFPASVSVSRYLIGQLNEKTLVIGTNEKLSFFAIPKNVDPHEISHGLGLSAIVIGQGTLLTLIASVENNTLSSNETKIVVEYSLDVSSSSNSGSQYPRRLRLTNSGEASYIIAASMQRLNDDIVMLFCYEQEAKYVRIMACGFFVNETSEVKCTMVKRVEVNGFVRTNSSLPSPQFFDVVSLSSSSTQENEKVFFVALEQGVCVVTVPTTFQHISELAHTVKVVIQDLGNMIFWIHPVEISSGPQSDSDLKYKVLVAQSTEFLLIGFSSKISPAVLSVQSMPLPSGQFPSPDSSIIPPPFRAPSSSSTSAEDFVFSHLPYTSPIWLNMISISRQAYHYVIITNALCAAKGPQHQSAGPNLLLPDCCIIKLNLKKFSLNLKPDGFARCLLSVKDVTALPKEYLPPSTSLVSFSNVTFANRLMGPRIYVTAFFIVTETFAGGKIQQSEVILFSSVVVYAPTTIEMGRQYSVSLNLTDSFQDPIEESRRKPVAPFGTSFCIAELTVSSLGVAVGVSPLCTLFAFDVYAFSIMEGENRNPGGHLSWKDAVSPHGIINNKRIANWLSVEGMQKTSRIPRTQEGIYGNPHLFAYSTPTAWVVMNLTQSVVQLRTITGGSTNFTSWEEMQDFRHRSIVFRVPHDFLFMKQQEEGEISPPWTSFFCSAGFSTVGFFSSSNPSTKSIQSLSQLTNRTNLIFVYNFSQFLSAAMQDVFVDDQYYFLSDLNWFTSLMFQFVNPLRALPLTWRPYFPCCTTWSFVTCQNAKNSNELLVTLNVDSKSVGDGFVDFLAIAILLNISAARPVPIVIHQLNLQNLGISALSDQLQFQDALSRSEISCEFDFGRIFSRGDSNPSGENIYSLNLAGNYLTGTISFIQLPSTMVNLKLNDNLFTNLKLPVNVTRLTTSSLQLLDFSSNTFSGNHIVQFCLSSWINFLYGILPVTTEVVDLSNSFTKVDPEYGLGLPLPTLQCSSTPCDSNLQKLSLADNDLIGDIGLKNASIFPPPLVFLNLSWNPQLTNRFNFVLFQSRHRLVQNSHDGLLQEDASSPSQLQILDVSHCGLNGSISLHHLAPQLYQLILSDNQFEGDIEINFVDQPLRIDLTGNKRVSTIVAANCPIPASSSNGSLCPSFSAFTQSHYQVNISCTNSTDFFCLEFNKTAIAVPNRLRCNHEHKVLMLPSVGGIIELLHDEIPQAPFCRFDARKLWQNSIDHHLVLWEELAAAFQPCLPLFQELQNGKGYFDEVTGNISFIFHRTSASIVFSPLDCAFVIPNGSFCGVTANPVTNTKFTFTNSLTEIYLTTFVGGPEEKLCRYEVENHDAAVVFLHPSGSSSSSDLYSLYPFNSFFPQAISCINEQLSSIQFQFNQRDPTLILTLSNNQGEVQLQTAICPQFTPITGCKVLPTAQLPSNDEDAAFSTVEWYPCDTTKWRVGFHPISRDIPLSISKLILNEKAPPPTASINCESDVKTCSVSQNGNRLCNRTAGKYSDLAVCYMMQHFSPQGVMTDAFHNRLECKEVNSSDNNFNFSGKCVGSPAEQTMVCRLLETFRTNLSEMSTLLSCSPGGHYVYLLDPVTKNVVTTLKTDNGYDPRCDKAFYGLRVRCSKCLPYIEPDAIAIPYWLLGLSSIKDIFLIVMGYLILKQRGCKNFVTNVMSWMILELLPYIRQEKSEWKEEWKSRLNPDPIDESEFLSCFNVMLQDPKVKVSAKHVPRPSRFGFSQKRASAVRDSSPLGTSDSDSPLRDEWDSPSSVRLTSKDDVVAPDDDMIDIGDLQSTNDFYMFYVDKVTCGWHKLVKDPHSQHVQKAFRKLKAAFDDLVSYKEQIEKEEREIDQKGQKGVGSLLKAVLPEFLSTGSKDSSGEPKKSSSAWSFLSSDPLEPVKPGKLARHASQEIEEYDSTGNFLRTKEQVFPRYNTAPNGTAYDEAVPLLSSPKSPQRTTDARKDRQVSNQESINAAANKTTGKYGEEDPANDGDESRNVSAKPEEKKHSKKKKGRHSHTEQQQPSRSDGVINGGESSDTTASTTSIVAQRLVLEGEGNQARQESNLSTGSPAIPDGSPTSFPPISCMDEGEERLDNALRSFQRVAKTKCVILQLDAVDKKFMPQPWMLVLEMLFGFIFLIVCVIDATDTTYNPWDRYQAIYFRYNNSCVAIGFIVNSVIRRIYLCRSLRSGTRLPIRPDFFIVVSTLYMLPSILTHVIPGLFVFFPITFPLFSIFCLIFRWVWKKEQTSFASVKFSAIAFRLIFRLSMTFCFTLMLQTTMNYAILFYQRKSLNFDGQGYFKLVWMIMKYEYASRRHDCFFDRVERLVTHFQLFSTFV